jgi:hypothetical protein
VDSYAAAIRDPAFVAMQRTGADWLRVVDDLPWHLGDGPDFRLRFAIEQLIQLRLQILNPWGDDDPARAEKVMNRVIAAILGRDWKTWLAIRLIREIKAQAGYELVGAPPERRVVFWFPVSHVYPENAATPGVFARAVGAWVACERGKRADRWGAIADAIASAGLGKRSRASLKRQWRAYQAKANHHSCAVNPGQDAG